MVDTITPIMFVLLFAFVFGGAIQTPGVSYITFLMPGIFVQTVVFGGTGTAVGLAEDLQKGIIDRFRSLPMAPSGVLIGRTFADLIRNAYTVLIMTGVGFLIGFRFTGSVAGSSSSRWPSSRCSDTRSAGSRRTSASGRSRRRPPRARSSSRSSP